MSARAASPIEVSAANAIVESLADHGGGTLGSVLSATAREVISL